ncbi:MAG: GxxExxY protein [Candidatus Pacebacteria bacterium]|nr:GxxExxY protein [Candidatus Paceibacterota bacterium]
MDKKIVKDFLYEKETYLIRGACFEVWKEFGGAFKEKVVDRALNVELKNLGLNVESQKIIDVYFRDKKIASYVPDKIINNAVLLEIKCKPFLTREDERQFWLYLKGSKYKLGLLINFGPKKLEIKRRIYDKAREKTFQRKSALLSAFISFYIMANLFFPITAKAEGVAKLGLSVSPQVFELEVFPGEKIIRRINVKNLSDVPLPISIRTTDFTAKDDSGEMEFDDASQDISIASRKWFNFEKADFILDVNETEVINFEISIPKEAEPGGHYSVILFEPQLPSFYFKEGQPKTVPIVGVLFLISVRVFSLEPLESKNLVEIVEFKIPKEKTLQNLGKVMASLVDVVPGVQAAEVSIVEKTPDSVILRIKNNDIYHHKLNGKILVYNSFGKKVGESEVKKTTILPGKIRKFPVSFSEIPANKIKWLPAFLSNFIYQNNSFGKYKIVLELEEEKNQIELNQTLGFWIFPWKIILIITFALGILILLRKRIFAAVRMIFKSNLKNQKSPPKADQPWAGKI